MHLSEILITELDAFRKRAEKEKIDIVETGSIRGEGDNYRSNDGWSTLTFAEYVKKHGGTLTSIDLDTETADKVLRAHKMRSTVTLLQGHSVDVLSSLVSSVYSSDDPDKKMIDVAFLDSDNCGALIFHEYLVVNKIMRSPGLIIVDDVDITSTGAVKGHEILPWARQNNIDHRVLERAGQGYTTGVLVFEV